ncbi:hypothetical protein HanRHA438_Chr01g0032291 [Helianthus annuus]|uniref:Endonuclease/exonuclease/phosphatase n=1 Tax=Helianthus annuus TaxID=4232 RepID=A0A9K3P3M4_HELAN|nr:uncharacterized protein LOC118491333 [Helianthus annuus]KAF5822831.1 hypothetical protein HanXRQr2_Chr01g0031501 [Helianthus annuus]KAJ0627617.1 hypothetical protein HanHA89_Chr01g0027821 [Helianthus annuus]KAJ0783917.1 hypothetical protein HanLR1_Chr01g0026411 [Helianthus annuus]KAJ0948849.1 hypothetical protein HanRHA438_Chr01g0032291 [Helianthus annuus]KAJ0957706.1 hypothetical protein HanPSC8_Chr01g0030771 [Helianthus annuus]
MTGGKFTFVSDNLEVKMSKIDRFLVNAEFMHLWPLANLEVQNSGLSDHCPLALSCISHDFGPIPFKFFNSWVGEERLVKIVESISAVPNDGELSDIFLANTLRNIKKEIKKLRQEVTVAENKEVKGMLDIIGKIEKKTESMPLTQIEKRTRVDLRVQLKKLEAIKVKNLQQKARVNWIRFGDENSSFFHRLINVNIVNNRINGLRFRDSWISDPIELKMEVRNWFKKQFLEPIRRRPKFANIRLPRLSE